jgi:hypothetical protein
MSMSYVTALTLFHTAISILAIPVGVMAVLRLFNPGLPSIWTRSFLRLAFVTSATGFLFPFGGVTPAIVVGVLALLILGAVIYARGRTGEAGLWRWVYAGGIVASLWLDVFVFIAQAFAKVPFLHQYAPTGAGPVFAVTQGIVLVAFGAVGVMALRRFRP